MRLLAGIACAAALLPPAGASGQVPPKGGTVRLTTAQAEALVREVSATVEQLRKLRFKAPVAVEVVEHWSGLPYEFTATLPSWQLRHSSEVPPGEVFPCSIACEAFGPACGAPGPLSYIEYAMLLCSVWFHSGR